MPRTKQRSAQTDPQQGRGERGDLYAEVTAKIIAELEAGRFPWVQPWGKSGTGAATGLPRNALTRRTYSGINILILWGAVIEHGYADQSWLTFRQAQEAGGNVIKGERGVSPRALFKLSTSRRHRRFLRSDRKVVRLLSIPPSPCRRRRCSRSARLFHEPHGGRGSSR